MTPASVKLKLRNATIETLMAVDKKLAALTQQPPSNRVVADVRSLLEHRSELVAILIDLNGEPPPLPSALNPNQTKVTH